jgi:hypothetical protein
VAEILRIWVYNFGVAMAFTEPGSPSEKGYFESFNGKFTIHM